MSPWLSASRPAGKVLALWRRLRRDDRGGVFAEHVLLLTIVGLGAIAAVAVLRAAMAGELMELSEAIPQIILP